MEERIYATALGELLYGTGLNPARAERFTQAMWPVFKRQAAGNPFAQARIWPSLFLMLVYPDQDIAVRTDVFDAAARALLGQKILRFAPFSAGEYADVLALATGVRRELERWGWRPRDFMDVHSFLWVVTRPSYNEDDEHEE